MLDFLVICSHSTAKVTHPDDGVSYTTTQKDRLEWAHFAIPNGFGTPSLLFFRDFVLQPSGQNVARDDDLGTYNKVWISIPVIILRIRHFGTGTDLSSPHRHSEL